MKLKAQKLTAQQAYALLQRFAEEHGPETIEAAYGWDNGAPRSRQHGERMWAFTDRELPAAATVGWGSCHFSVVDPNDEEAIIALGVFPSYERQGYRHAIYDWICAKVQREGAKRATIVVFHVNEAQYLRTLVESEAGPWQHAGEVWFPQGYGVFTRLLEAPERPPADGEGIGCIDGQPV